MNRWIPLFVLAAACGNSGNQGANDLIDQDGDGFFANDANVANQDCDDRPQIGQTIYPGATEVCNGRDDDCNGTVDDDYAEGARLYYPDNDGDGFGRFVPEPFEACNLPEGYSINRRDCNDNDPDIFPLAPERCNDLDDNCNLEIDEGFDKTAIWFDDADRDGYGGTEQVGEGCALEPGWVRDDNDCNDFNRQVNPEAPEICDGIDNDCDNRIDRLDDDVVGTQTWYEDADGDTYGNVLVTTQRCADDIPPPGFVTNFDDCDDDDPLRSPESVWFLDNDHDGFGDRRNVWPGNNCWQPIGYSLNALDCDDDDPEEWSTRLWFTDSDRDGYGSNRLPAVWEGCNRQDGWVPRQGDCNDRDPAVNRDAFEVCDGVDNDCDNLIDDNDDDVIGTTVWYRDNDNDGYGVFFRFEEACVAPSGFVADSGDCDDANPDITPETLWFRDADRDGWGDPDNQYPTPSCAVVPGHVPNNIDCDDADFYRYNLTPWYPDEDLDLIGTGNVAVAFGCLDGTPGIAPISGDCDDTDPNETTGDCFGPQLGIVTLDITTDRDPFGTTILMDCQDEGPVIGPGYGTPPYTLPINLFFESNRQIVTQVNPLGANDTCTLRIIAPDTDLARDGFTRVEIRTCGTFVQRVQPTQVEQILESAPFRVARCSGCTDPAATNYDPTAQISTNADSCIYAP